MEEAREQARQRDKLRRKAANQRRLAGAPFDLTFFLLVLLLNGIGLVMLLSASFPSAGIRPGIVSTDRLST